MKKLKLISIILLLFLFSFGSIVYGEEITIQAMIAGVQDVGPAVDMFMEQYPNINVELIDAPETSVLRRDRYVSMFAAQDGSIDVIMTNTPQTPEYAASGWLEPLNKWINVDEYKEAVYPAYYESQTWNGKLYTLSGWGADVLNFYYRKDLLEEAGFAPPKTWEEVVEIAKEIKTDDRFGLVASWEGGNQVVCQFIIFSGSLGGKIIDDQGNVVINSSENIKALKFMTDMIHKDNIMPKDVLNLTVDDARLVFTEGDAIFHINWDYAWSMAQNEGSKIIGKTGIKQMPHFKNGKPATSLGGWFYAINKFSDNKEASVKFIKFLASEKIQKWMVNEAGYTSQYKNIMSDKEFIETHPEWSAALDKNYQIAIERPKTPYYGEIINITSRHLMQALHQEKTPEEALNEAQKALQDCLK